MKRMKFFGVLIYVSAIFSLFTFYIFPVLADSADPRNFVKSISFFFLILSIYSYFAIRLQKNQNLVNSPNLNLTKEIIFMNILIVTFSFSYLYRLEEHLYSFFLVDFDFLSLAEILNNFISGKFFQTHHYGNGETGNYLAHHFSPSIFILSPFLLLSETRLGYAYGLLLYINLTILLFGILLIRKNIRGNLFVFSMILMVFNLHVNRLFLSYHWEMLILFFFLFLFLLKDLKFYFSYWICILFLLFLKEDISIYLICLGFYYLIQKNWKLGFSIILISTLYFLFVPKFFQQFMDRSSHINWISNWSKWGVTYPEIIINLISNPLYVLPIFFENWKILKEFFLSFSPIILLSPTLILVTLPIFLIHFLSDRVWYNTLYNYYSYSVISFFVIGIIFSVQKLESTKLSKYSLSILLLCISISLYSSSGDKLFPFIKTTVDMNRVSAVKFVLSHVPKHKIVVTQFDLGGFVSRDNPIYPLHEKNLNKDYILVDTNKGISPYITKDRIQNMIQSIQKNNTHKLFIEKEGILLFKKY